MIWSASDVWLAKGDLKEAEAEAERFLALTEVTAERTWQALAWEASARVAMAGGDHSRARWCIEHALSTMEGFEVPLAAWRVHGSAIELEKRAGNHRAAARHHAFSRATILALANSLAHDEHLRETFLAAPSVHAIVARG
jgi:hypothetical protein